MYFLLFRQRYVSRLSSFGIPSAAPLQIRPQVQKHQEEEEEISTPPSFFFWGGGYGHVEKEEDITCDTLAYIFRIEAKKSYRALNTVVVEYRTSLIRRWIYQPDNSWRCTVYTQKPPPPPNWPIRLRVRFLSWILGRIRTCQHVEYLKRKM